MNNEDFNYYMEYHNKLEKRKVKKENNLLFLEALAIILGILLVFPIESIKSIKGLLLVIFVVIIVIIIKSYKSNRKETDNKKSSDGGTMSNGELDYAINTANRIKAIIDRINNSPLSGRELIQSDIIEHPGIALRKDENCVYKNNAVMIKYDVKTVYNSYGSNYGLSTSLFKYYRLHTGKSFRTTHADKKLVEQSITGTLYFTGLRILFETVDKIIEIDRNDIIKIEPYQDGIVFKATKEKTYIFHTNDMEKIMGILVKINKVVKEDSEKKDTKV